MAANPCHDPLLVSGDPANMAEYTLPVGRDATLTLATESLVVLDETSAQRAPTNCCSLGLPQKSISTRSIPYFNILWAELTLELNIIITHASPLPSKTPLSRIGSKKNSSTTRVSKLEYAVDKTTYSTAQSFVSRLLDRAYGASQRRKRIKVLINPLGGTGNAPKWYNRDIAPILIAANCELDVVTTRYSGHAKEIAETLDIDAYDVILCCSGDGTPHEVFNGLGARMDGGKALRQLAVAQLPCGSGNAMCHNLNGTESPSLAALCTVKGLRIPMDLVSITQGSERYLSFLSQAVGIVAESDLGTDNLRWMGDFRFTYGFLTRVLGKTCYPMDIAVRLTDDNKASIAANFRNAVATAQVPPQSSRASETNLLDTPISHMTNDKDLDYPQDIKTDSDALPPLRYGTISDPLPTDWTLESHPNIGNFYCGNMAYMAADMHFFRTALPNDGNLDMVNIEGDCSRLAALKLLLEAGEGKMFENKLVSYRKVEAYRLIPRQTPKQMGSEGYISIDGERVPFAPFQVEVHRGLATVLSRSGKGYEGPPLES